MVDNNLTAIAVVLDKSGSMSSVVDDTIGGFNAFVKDQIEEEGEATLSLTLFDTTFDRRYVNVPLDKVELLDRKNYVPGGMTALVDAVGTTIDELGRQLAVLPEEKRPGKVIFVIQTDGQENSSREFKTHQVAEKIKHQQDKYGWAFLFMGADQDAWSQAGGMGIARGNTISYVSADSAVAYAMGSTTARSFRRGKVTAQNLTGTEDGVDLRENKDTTDANSDS